MQALNAKLAQRQVVRSNRNSAIVRPDVASVAGPVVANFAGELRPHMRSGGRLDLQKGHVRSTCCLPKCVKEYCNSCYS